MPIGVKPVTGEDPLVLCVGHLVSHGSYRSVGEVWSSGPWLAPGEDVRTIDSRRRLATLTAGQI
jgi:hypothetical protein